MVRVLKVLQVDLLERVGTSQGSEKSWQDMIKELSLVQMVLNLVLVPLFGCLVACLTFVMAVAVSPVEFGRTTETFSMS